MHLASKPGKYAMKTHWMLDRYWTLECVVSLRCNLWVKSQNLQTHNLAPLLVCKISSCLPICGVQGLVQQLRLPNLCQNQRWQLIGMQACGTTCQVFNCEVLLTCCVDIKQQKLRFSMLYCCTKSQERVKQHNLPVNAPILGEMLKMSRFYELWDRKGKWNQCVSHHICSTLHRVLV